jgi:branched-chain amino acid transport system substrate-binding protein
VPLARPVRVMAAALLGAAALGLTACGSNKSDTVSPITPQTSPAGVIRPVLELGFLGALTGPDAQLGINIKAGEQLAVSQYDVDNPALTVEIDAFDSQGLPARAAEGATRLAHDKVVAVIGPTLSSEAAVADPIFEAAGIPNLTASATGAQLAENGWSYFHRIVADGSAQAAGDADYLVKTLGQKAVAVVDDSSPDGVGLADAVRTALVTSGGVDVFDGHVAAAAGTSDSRAVARVVARVVAAKAGAVFFGGYSGPASRLVAQLRSAGYDGDFLTDAGASDSNFVGDPGPAVGSGVGASGASGASGRVAGVGASAGGGGVGASAGGGGVGASAGGGSGRGAIGGTYVSCPCANVAGGTTAQVFDSAYRAAYGSAPGAYAAEAYSATAFVLAAIKSGATTPLAINIYLGTNSYVGLTDTIRFLSDGDISAAPVYIYQLKNGRTLRVATTH